MYNSCYHDDMTTYLILTELVVDRKSQYLLRNDEDSHTFRSVDTVLMFSLFDCNSSHSL